MRYNYFTYLLVIVFGFLNIQTALSQDRFIHSLNTLPHFANPSYFGFKDPSKVGIVSEFVSAQANSVSQHQYAFATAYFEENNFQLGLEYMNTQLDNAGLRNSQAKLSYIYKLKLENQWYVYPGITAGFGGYNFDYGSLVFSDQIDILTGQVNTQTSDPVVIADNLGFVDFGASFMAHNDYNMSFGLAIKHLNKPKLSTEFSEQVYNLDMLFSAQFAYEFNLNKYKQGRLPDYSYLHLFQVVSKQGVNTRVDLYQDLIMGNMFFGLKEHISSLGGFNLFQIGLSAGMKIESLDVGFSYTNPMGLSKIASPSAFEIFLSFDLSSFRERNRKDFSRFY